MLRYGIIAVTFCRSGNISKIYCIVGHFEGLNFEGRSSSAYWDILRVVLVVHSGTF